jgi:excisionase family DNA binding protein
MTRLDPADRMLTPGEVAALFRVDPKTVTNWAAAGRIGSIRTPGGHRRFRESEVRALLSDYESPARQDPDPLAGGPQVATTGGPDQPRTAAGGYRRPELGVLGPDHQPEGP